MEIHFLNLKYYDFCLSLTVQLCFFTALPSCNFFVIQLNVHLYTTSSIKPKAHEARYRFLHLYSTDTYSISYFACGGIIQ